jgi:hypothetical protein
MLRGDKELHLRTGPDYFSILGLAPGRYESAEVERRFRAERKRLLLALDDPRRHEESVRDLDRLHVAYAALHHPRAQGEYLHAIRGEDRVARLRQIIAASLEDGLLRYSRRQQILEIAHEAGFSDFHAQLLIAQVQFGDDSLPLAPCAATGPAMRENPRAWARFAAAGVLGLAIFLYMVHQFAV